MLCAHNACGVLSVAFHPLDATKIRSGLPSVAVVCISASCCYRLVWGHLVCFLSVVSVFVGDCSLGSLQHFALLLVPALFQHSVSVWLRIVVVHVIVGEPEGV